MSNVFVNNTENVGKESSKILWVKGIITNVKLIMNTMNC